MFELDKDVCSSFVLPHVFRERGDFPATSSLSFRSRGSLFAWRLFRDNYIMESVMFNIHAMYNGLDNKKRHPHGCWLATVDIA